MSGGTNSLMTYAKEISLLSKEDEVRLAAMLHDDNPQVVLDARNVLVEANMRFIAQMAHGYSKGSSANAFDEYMSAGLEAAVKNAHKFDPERANFCTFIKPWIQKAFQEIHYFDSVVAVPRHKQIALKKVNRTIEALVVEYGNMVDITNEMIAERAGMTVSDVESCLTIDHEYLSYTPSLDAPLSKEEEGAVLADVLNHQHLDDYFEDDFSESTQYALSELSTEEAQVVLLISGLGPLGSATIDEVAEHLGISVSKVRSLKNSAKKKMKAHMELSSR
jgi:RNA polymerase sigma factor (sigma-70 family)